jgi:predicted DCC family thiol-disulfide oxidoreductase YuxK
MPETTDNEMPIAFYDGGCPLCRREIAHYQRLDRDGCIRWVDIHAHPDVLSGYGLSRERAMQRMHVRESDGSMVTGASAFIALWQRMPRYRPLAWLVSLPGILWIAERLYDVFARWRWRDRCDDACEKP